jgi:cell shape-determining protein MreC
MERTNLDRQKFILSIQLAIVTVLLFLTNFLPFGGALRSFVGFYASPVSYWSFTTGEAVNSSFNSLAEIGSVREELNRTKLKLAQAESNNYILTKISEENEALRQQIKLSNKNLEYLEVPVLSGGLLSGQSYLYIGAGTNSDIKIGSRVVIGNAYIGTVDEVSSYSSKVVLPSQSKTYLQVTIIHNLSVNEDLNVEQIEKQLLDTKKWGAVMVGSIRGMKLENISMDSEVKVGDYVIANDEKIGMPLAIGKISEIEAAPSSAMKVAYVDPIMNNSELKYVFIVK